MLTKFLFVLLFSGVAFAAPTVQEFKLGNGLKILVREDQRTPVVVSQLWYKVGSSYEPSGMTGISHALEHMMFKGTATIGPGEFSRIIAANGGSENAFTSRDYTAYYQKLAKDRLAVSFRLEAERMRQSRLAEEDIAKELKVIEEERRLRTDDSPESLTQEYFYATAYLTSPYRNPVIGWMNDIKSLTAEDIKRWYQKWYAPNNATLVVVGDVDSQQVLELAKTYFGPLQPSELPTLQSTAEIPQQGEKRIIVKVPAELPYVVLGYQVPVLKTAEQNWEPYALEVLSGILDGGSSSRLSRKLIRGSQVAVSAGASYNMTSRLNDLFILTVNPAPGHDLAEVERALRNQVKELRETLVDSAELARVVAQVIASEVYQRDSTFYQAMQMGILETVGLGWKVQEEYVDCIKAVTAEQLREVARKYLSDDRLTVATLEPLPLQGKRPRSPAGMTGNLLH
jgi:zinc protease